MQRRKENSKNRKEKKSRKRKKKNDTCGTCKNYCKSVLFVSRGSNMNRLLSFRVNRINTGHIEPDWGFIHIKDVPQFK
jgi:hypothetical protein